MVDRMSHVVEAAEKFVTGVRKKHPENILTAEAYILAASLWRAFPKEARLSFTNREHEVMGNLLKRMARKKA